MKILPMGEDFYADGTDRLTDLTKLTVAFGNFANASVTSQLIPYRETVTVMISIQTRNCTVWAQCGIMKNGTERTCP